MEKLNFCFEILSFNPIYFSIKYYVFAQLWPKNSINWIMRLSHWKLYPHQTHLLRGNVSKDFLQFQQYDLGRCSQHHRGLSHLGHLRSSYLIIIHFFFMLVKNLKLSESFSFDKPAFAKDLFFPAFLYFILFFILNYYFSLIIKFNFVEFQMNFVCL